MRLYIHKMTIRYLDYGDLLETVHGIAWSNDGNPQNAVGFERGQTVEGARLKFIGKAPAEGWELIEGPEVSRSDMNPHGFI